MARKAKPADPVNQEAKDAPVMGRPSNYKPEYATLAAKLCKLGATDTDLADFFEVSVRTIANWQARHPDFVQALKSGKTEADDRVERSLYQKAVGYEYDAVKIFQYEGSPVIVPYRERVPPDTTAAIFWLKNRRQQEWRDVHKHEHGGPGDFDRMSDDELREFIARGATEKGEGRPSASAPRNKKTASSLN